MRRGIATVSLSGVLSEKLAAIAGAGFDGVEIFDNDLIASPLPPREVGRLCADLGLTIDLFQPLRDVEGVEPERFPATLHRVRRKLEVMRELGATTVLACSNALPDAVDDADLRTEQLHAVGELAASFGVTVAYEALAWGRHVNRVRDAWTVVSGADHPAVTLAVDTFHLLARGDDGAALAGIPGERIGFLQVADAPLLDMNVLEWSRHFRCFPGQGTLDVAGVVEAVLAAGYRGPLSLEVFSDVVREADPTVTARDAMRSLVFLEDQLSAGAVEPGLVAAAPPAPRRTDVGFVELAAPADSAYPWLLDGLGFHVAGRHRTKPVVWWRNGGANVLLNHAPTPGPAATALGLVAPPVAGVADRAAALLWPALDRTRGAGEADLSGITSPSGLHVFVSAAQGETDDWRCDFVRVDADASPGGWAGLDHIGVAVDADSLNEELSFFRTLFGLVPGQLEEFIDPHGRLRSRALRPPSGDVRVVLNVEDRAWGAAPRRGVTQLAFATADVAADVRRARARGVDLLQPPDNYYADLDAQFGLEPAHLDRLREHGLLYDRVGDGELLHAYTVPLPGGFQVELLERRGGYDAYGAAGTHVRLAAVAALEAASLAS